MNHNDSASGKDDNPLLQNDKISETNKENEDAANVVEISPDIPNVQMSRSRAR